MTPPQEMPVSTYDVDNTGLLVVDAGNPQSNQRRVRSIMAISRSVYQRNEPRNWADSYRSDTRQDGAESTRGHTLFTSVINAGIPSWHTGVEEANGAIGNCGSGRASGSQLS